MKGESMTRYAEKLRDPRWQRMRLEVMQRDGFSCQECGDTQTTLNVHHKHYLRGRDPWQYPLTALETLCENCHKAEHGRSEAKPNKTECIASSTGQSAIVALVGCCCYFILDDRRALFKDDCSPEMLALTSLVEYFDGLPVPWDEDQWPGVRARFAETKHAVAIEAAYSNRVEWSSPQEARAELERVLDRYKKLKRQARVLLRHGITSIRALTPEQRAIVRRVLSESRP
jgi:hypothetical protein